MAKAAACSANKVFPTKAGFITFVAIVRDTAATL